MRIKAPKGPFVVTLESIITSIRDERVVGVWKKLRYAHNCWTTFNIFNRNINIFQPQRQNLEIGYLGSTPSITVADSRNEPLCGCKFVARSGLVRSSDPAKPTGSHLADIKRFYVDLPLRK